ncbi:single-stranded DNA-binding protein [Lactobacillus delbrueckii]|uniref:single-stranded DNA-binding protein n=1 Tax=Lactobacillus delbrueckii TaxID=1584 RepID=UPI0025AF7967|nr:single-stranded DNA-binding protein [Lactobacillus delbrueckii]
MAEANNCVTLIGRLTRDPELRSSQSSTSVVSFGLAVDQTFRGKDGQRGVDFIDCVIWGKQAETLSQYAHKGDTISTLGSLHKREYTNREGQKVRVTEVHVDRFNFLPSGQRNNAQQTQEGAQGGYGYGQGNHPQGTTQAPQGQPGQAGTIDLSSDDLPF